MHKNLRPNKLKSVNLKNDESVSESGAGSICVRDLTVPELNAILTFPLHMHGFNAKMSVPRFGTKFSLFSILMQRTTAANCIYIPRGRHFHTFRTK